jgi:aspartate dehydrogenase
MTTNHKTERIGVIGMGAIGRRVVDALRAGCLAASPFAALEKEKHAGRVDAASGIEVFTSVDALIGWKPTLVIECAGHTAVADAVPALLSHGIDVVVASVGALADDQLRTALDKASREGSARLILASGAIGGLDALRSARAGGLAQVKYIGRKPPRAWAGSPAEESFELSSITQPTTIFKGTARQAARLYPKNANVTAAVALSGVGFDATEVELVADPSVSTNVHEVEAAGGFGRLVIRLENNPLPDNPKTSWLAALSIEEAVERRFANMTF